MLNYIHADLHRIFRRISRCIIIVLILAIGLGNEFYQAVSRNYNSVNMVAASANLFETILLVVGLVELQSVFADDFRAKTMQIAIGIGISRPEVVLVKLIDFAILSLVDSLVMLVLFVLGSTGCGIQLQGDQLYMLFIFAVGNALYLTIAAALTMIPVFYTQSTGLALLLFLVISFDPVKVILTLFGTKPIVLNLHLLELPYSTVANTLMTQLSLRNAVPIPQLIGVIAYLAVSYGLTVLAFNKRELEF